MVITEEVTVGQRLIKNVFSFSHESMVENNNFKEGEKILPIDFFPHFSCIFYSQNNNKNVLKK